MRVFICLEIGENMKKIIKIITIIMTFFIMSKTCYASTEPNVEKISNTRIHLKTNNINEIRNMYYITDKDNIFYSIELNNQYYGFSYDEYNYYGGMNNLSEELKNRIGLIAYYGYGYQNRTDIKWYTITQFMIWNELVKEEKGEIYFIDQNGNKMDIYQNEMEEILKDIADHYILPSFLEPNNRKTQYDLKLNEKLIFEDKNNVLSKYKIEHSGEISYKIENNKVIITPLAPNYVSLSFSQKASDAKYLKLYYNSSHKLINRGEIVRPGLSIILNIALPKIKIKGTFASKLSIEDNLYDIYFENGNEFYRNISLKPDGISEEISIMPGSYYLVQTKAAYGYKLNPKKIEFIVSKDDKIIEINSELETKHVIIEKLIIDKEKIKPASNTKLKIYNESNELFKELTTNSEGKGYIDLPYGIYRIIENELSRESKKVYTLKIDENYNEEESFVIKEESNSNESEIESSKDNNDKLESELPKGNIIIKKYDYLTNKPLVGIKIALFNQNKKLIKEGTTNSEGKLIFKDIETGTYYLKEIINDDNYELEDAVKIEVKEDIDTIITSNNRTMIEVPNTLINNNINRITSIILITSGILFMIKKNKNEEI